MNFFDFFRRRKPAASEQASDALSGIDPETLEIARQLAYEKKIREAGSKKWRKGRKGSDIFTDDDILEALAELKPSARRIIDGVFQRTVEDTVLSNRYMDSAGKEFRHLTVKKATGMDGLRDIGDVQNAGTGVSPMAANPMNPEGKIPLPTIANAKHEFAERFSEAMNPRTHGRFNLVPELILEHYSKFATFIGYPLCELIATHPTVSNACSIPGEDAIAPGYRLSFIDSEDVDGDGYPDELEVMELGGVKRSMERISAMEGLKNAIVTLSGDGGNENSGSGNAESLNALAVSLERLAAYEEWERTAGNGDETAQAVKEGLVTPVSDALTGYVNRPDADSRRDALAALSLALADISKAEHPILDEVRATNRRRGTVAAVSAAYISVTREADSWDSERSLNDLAVAVERVAAYEDYSDKNAEVKAALQMALISLSQRISPETREQAAEALRTAHAAMDADDFAFTDPNEQARREQAVAQQQAQQGPGGGMATEGIASAAEPAQAVADFRRRSEEQRMRNAQASAEQRLRNAQAVAEQRMQSARANADMRAQNAQAAADLKLRHAQAQQELRLKSDQANADLKAKMMQLQMEQAKQQHALKQEQAQQQMDAERSQQEMQQRQMEQQMQLEQAQQMAQVQAAQQQQQAEAERKQKADKKREETKEKARAAKERQRALDELKKRADDLGLNKVCEGLARNARIFGIGIAVPVVEGADYERPFDIDAIREGSYKGFTLIEPTWIYPEVDADDLVNPISRSFFEPNYWAVTGANHIGDLAVRRIHRSWMVIVRNKEVPTMLRPMYYYGGIPLTQEIYEAVFCADKVMNEVPKLAMTKRTTIVKGDINDLIVNPDGVVRRLQAYSQVQDNFGILFTGRNTDVQKLETSLSEFDQLIAKCNQRIAAIAKMPETKLFKTQLAGMNSAGRYEWDDYSQLLINIQNRWYTPLLSLHYALDTKSRTGKVIAVKISFNAIDVPTQSEKEQAESSRVQTINAATQGGWLSPQEARTIARSSDESMFSSISAEMPEELEQAQQQAQAQGGMPGGDQMAAMMGGMGGGQQGGGSPLEEPDEKEEPKAPQERK